MKPKPIQYIFNPQTAFEALAQFPLLQKKLPSPYKEGEPSSAFPNYRKSSKEIFRILSNQHYSNLRSLLAEIEFALSNGFGQPKLIKTSSSKDFQSSVSELLLTNFFANNGFHISSFDETKGSSPVPDMHLSHNELSILGEVYSPRNWDGFDLFFGELKKGLKNLDSPFDFNFCISCDLIKHLDSNSNLLIFDPWEFSDFFILPSKRLDYISSFLEKVQSQIENSSQSGFQESLLVESCNTEILVKIESIKKSQKGGLNRHGSLCYSLSGYAPEAMFKNLLKRGVKEKDKKNQVGAILGNHFRVLIIDVSKLEYLDCFENECYLKVFKNALLKEFSIETMNADLLLFVKINMKPLTLSNYLHIAKNEIPTKLYDTIF